MPSRSPAARPAPQYPRERTYDVQHIRLEVHVDPRRPGLRARATLRLAPFHDGCRHLALDLASELVVRTVRLSGRRIQFQHREDFLHVDLGRPHPGGRTLEIAVEYSGRPRRGLYFVGPDAAHPHRLPQAWTQGQDEDSKHWFPCYDSPSDKCTSETIATVPRPFRAISNGRLVSVTESARAGTRTFHWREEFPHPAYLVSLVVGEFAELRQEADGVPLCYFVPPRDVQSARRTFGATPRMLGFFSQVTGYPYPYEKYAQVVVQDFIFGGMENLTATTLTDAVLLDTTAAIDFRSDSLIAHELAHQWWGNLVTCKEWSHAWLNEGFATYFDALWTEKAYGRDEFHWQMAENARDYFREDEERYRRPIVERRWNKPIEIFDRHLYEKGALVLHQLRYELGDELFWKSIRHYVRKHQFQTVETTDLKVAIEEATGRSMARFFDQWVLGSGFPVLSASWSWRESERVLRVVVRQTQAVADGAMPFAFPLDIEVADSRSVHRHRVQVEAMEETFHLSAAGRPRYVRLDPDHALLARWQVEPGRDELLAQLQSGEDLYAVADAAQGLERFVGDAPVAAALSRALRRPLFFGAKRAVARTLGRIGGDSSRAALVDALADRDARARRGVVQALGEFRADPLVDAALRRAWRREKSYFVRGEIVAALARVGGTKALDLVRTALGVESFRDVVRVMALRAVAQVEDERGFELAMPFAARGHTRWARDAAFRTLAALGRLYPGRGRAAQDVLERALREGGFFATLSAVEALATLGRAAAIPSLRSIERADIDGRLQKAARDAIEAISSGTALPESHRALRARLDTLQEENRALRARLDKVEARLGGAPAHAPTRARAQARKRSG